MVSNALLKFTKFAKAGGPKYIGAINPVKFSKSSNIKLATDLCGDKFQSNLSRLRNLNLSEIIKDSLKIGEGCEARVYKIPDMDYVVRVPIERNSPPDISKISFNISQQDKINHAVANIEDCQIQKYIEGVNPRGYMCSWMKPTNDLTELAQLDEEIAKSIDNLSPEAIKKYYMQLAQANKCYMRHDYLGDNSLLNLKTGELIALDFTKGEDKHLLTSLVSQCLNPALTTTQQNNLLKKGTKSLLELVRDGKLKPDEIKFFDTRYSEEYQFAKLNDCEFVFKIKQLFSSFNKDSSKENIEKLLQQLEKIN